MKLAELNNLKYVTSAYCKIEESPNSKNILTSLITDTCLQNECYFVLDVASNKVVYSDGFRNFLGYDNDNVSIEMLSDLYHPEDASFMEKLFFALSNHTIDEPFVEKCNILNIMYRLKKKSDTYIKIISRTYVHEVCSDGKIKSVLVKFLDGSFLGNHPQLSWNVNPFYFNKSIIEKNIYKENKQLFTSRELDVIKEIFKGKTNVEISDFLNISLHTVATHRKNIFKKADCHSSAELIIFCSKKGILI